MAPEVRFVYACQFFVSFALLPCACPFARPRFLCLLFVPFAPLDCPICFFDCPICFFWSVAFLCPFRCAPFAFPCHFAPFALPPFVLPPSFCPVRFVPFVRLHRGRPKGARKAPVRQQNKGTKRTSTGDNGNKFDTQRGRMGATVFVAAPASSTARSISAGRSRDELAQAGEAGPPKRRRRGRRRRHPGCT